MFLLYFALCFNVICSNVKNIEYFKNKKLLSEKTYKKVLNDKLNIDENITIELLTEIFKNIDAKMDLEDIKIIEKILSTLPSEVIKNNFNINELSSNLDKIKDNINKDINPTINILKNRLDSFRFNIKSSISEKVLVNQRYDDSIFYPPILKFNPVEFLLKSFIDFNVTEDVKLHTVFDINNKNLFLSKLNLEIKKEIYLAYFMNNKNLPAMTDPFRLNMKNSSGNSIITILKLNRFDFIKSNLEILINVEQKSPTYFTKLKNSIKLREKNINPYLNLYYVEGLLKNNFIIIEPKLEIKNQIFRTLNINFAYSKMTSKDKNTHLNRMRSLKLFKIENRDAIIINSNLQLNSLKFLKIVLSMFEKGSHFDLNTKQIIVFNETDLIKRVDEESGGYFIKITLFEEYNYSLYTSFSRFKIKKDTEKKFTIGSLIKIDHLNNYLDVSINQEKLFYFNLLSMYTGKIDMKSSISLSIDENKKYSLNPFINLTIPISEYDISLGAMYFKSNMFEISNDLMIYTNFRSYSIDNLIKSNYIGTSELDISLGYSYKYNDENKFILFVSSKIEDFMKRNLKLVPKLNIKYFKKQFNLGFEIKTKYLISRNCVLSSSIGKINLNKNKKSLENKFDFIDLTVEKNVILNLNIKFKI